MQLRNFFNSHLVLQKTTRFKRRIVHGMLSGSLVSSIAAQILPGAGSVYISQNFTFRKPVFLNDTVTATIIVKEINKSKKFITFYTKVENQDGVVVIDGDAVTMAPADKFEL